MKILFVWPNKDSFGFKPLGLSLLSALARRQGWETKLLDTTVIDFDFTDNKAAGEQARIFKPVDLTPYGHRKRKIDLASHFTNLFEEFNPDCLAFSVLSDEVFVADEISGIAKKIHPRLPVIWGGKYPTINPEKTLLQHPVDFVCVGEGLDAFPEFLEGLAGRRDVTKIHNIWARAEKDHVIKNDVRPLRQNLDDLPYVDWEIFEDSQFYKPYEGKVYRSGDHMLNWGCPYHCTYCINHLYHNIYHNKYFVRRYSIGRIIAELKYLKERYSLEFFKFHDEDFLMRPLQNLAELGEAYRSEVNLPFVIETNPKSVTPEKVRCLKEMNCVSASLGVETGDNDLRKNLLGRADSETDIIRAFGLLNDAGIRTSSFIMLGIPFETRETYETTIRLLKQARVKNPCTGFFFPFEGTELRKTAINEGFYDPGQERVFKRNEPSLRFPHLCKSELIEMRHVFNLYVKLPEEFKPYIRRSETLDGTGRQLRTRLIQIYDDTVFANDGFYRDNGLMRAYLKDLEAICRQV